MALKSKFERIDQSKLKQGARDVLAKMKEKSENFTNAEVNKKIEPAIDKLIERLKKENPDALKKASATRTRKPKATAKKKATKKAPAKTSGAKRETVMTVAKRIRKDGEKWQDALKRAKSEMGKDTEKKVSAVKTEVDKLKKLIETDSVLKGFANSELQRDAVRKAKPRGKRKTSSKGETTNQYGTFKNKVGRTYWESRENRSDRYAPKYPKNKPFLEMGGDVTDAQDLSIANADFLVMAKGGEVADINKFKKQLIAKAKRKGLYENFGQAEVRKLEDKYGYSNNVREFDNWAMDFDLFDLSQMAKGGEVSVYGTNGKYYLKKYGRTYSNPSYKTKKEAENWARLINKGEYKLSNQGLEYIEEKNRFAKGGEIDAFTMSMVKGVDDGISEVETKDLKARMEKGGTLESKFDGYETMYKYALAKNFTPRQLAEELRFMTNLQNKGDKELYDFLNNLSNMYPDTPISEFQKGGKTKDVIIRQMVTSQDGSTYTLDEYQKLPNEKLMDRSPLAISVAKAKLFEYNDEAFDYEDEIMDIKDVDELADFVTEKNLGTAYNTYNDSWWGGVRLYVLVHNDGDKVDYDEETLIFMSYHRGGDVRGNYEKYEAFEMQGYLMEEFPIFADRMTVIVEKDGKSLTASTEDMEGYDLYIDESDFDKFEEGDNTNLDELGDELGFEAYKYYEKGGRLKSALMRDRKYYNKNEAWERAYSKGKNRRGYKENGGTIENSIQSYQNHYKGFPSYEKGGKIGYRE